jgi:hypothetical protein
MQEPTEAAGRDPGDEAAGLDEVIDPFVPVRSWEDAFARFEVELQVAVERATHPVPWRPPIALGPIPPELVGRAARILEAQLHAIRYLEDVRQTEARHAAPVDRVHVESAPHPVYFDLLGSDS